MHTASRARLLADATLPALRSHRPKVAAAAVGMLSRLAEPRFSLGALHGGLEGATAAAELPALGFLRPLLQ